jgi:murein DD-endopeptidase MepM/ murein hydrolase activator NlpD
MKDVRPYLIAVITLMVGILTLNGVILGTWSSGAKRELLNRAYHNAHKSFHESYKKELAHVPQKIKEKIYWEGRIAFDKMTREQLGVNTMAEWERLERDVEPPIKTQPTKGKPTVTSLWGPRRLPKTADGVGGGKLWGFHYGIDIVVPPNGSQELQAVSNGVVRAVATNHPTLGKYVYIYHDKDFQDLYGHMDRVYVKVGQSVTQGQVIGKIGNTGRSTGKHLHYSMIVKGKNVDPLDYLY